MGWTTVLRGHGDQLELNRLVGFVGGVAYVLIANALVAWVVIYRGGEFDITAYCLAFPGGLAVIINGTSAAVAIKDRNVATAKMIERGGLQTPTPSPCEPPRS